MEGEKRLLHFERSNFISAKALGGVQAQNIFSHQIEALMLTYLCSIHVPFPFSYRNESQRWTRLEWSASLVHMEFPKRFT